MLIQSITPLSQYLMGVRALVPLLLKIIILTPMIEQNNRNHISIKRYTYKKRFKKRVLDNLALVLTRHKYIC